MDELVLDELGKNLEEVVASLRYYSGIYLERTDKSTKTSTGYKVSRTRLEPSISRK
jgi:hypothetical protein